MGILFLNAFWATFSLLITFQVLFKAFLKPLFSSWFFFSSFSTPTTRYPQFDHPTIFKSISAFPFHTIFLFLSFTTILSWFPLKKVALFYAVKGREALIRYFCFLRNLFRFCKITWYPSSNLTQFGPDWSNF